MPQRNAIILVHVPDTVNAQHWAAMGSWLDSSGWLHTVGVCPTSSDEAGPTRQVLQALGCTTVCQLAELGLGQQGFTLALAAQKLHSGMTMVEAVAHFRRWEVSGDLYNRLQAMRESVRRILAHQTPRGEALVIASRHSWLLLALANQMVANDTSKCAIAELEALGFPGVGLIDLQGQWLGFYDQ